MPNDPWMQRAERETAIRLAVETQHPTADDVAYYRRKLTHREDVARVCAAAPWWAALLS